MKKKTPNILVFEGIWGVGKSTIISNLRNTYPVLFVPEPHHVRAGIKSKITEWYKTEHLRRMDLAKKYCNYGENTIMERSIIASVAFYYAQHHSVPEWFYSFADELSSLSNLYIIFLYNNKKIFLSKISEIENKKIIKVILDNESFYNNYINFYKNVFPVLIKNKVVCMKVSKSRQLSSDDKNYIKRLLASGHQKSKNKLKETKEYCASAVVYYKGKFLTIYSRNHMQYAFPQGHQVEGENILDTLKREVLEETGFNNLGSISKIKKYSYRFYHKNKITKKIIVCFLVELKSLKKTKKKFESHESYRNYFFTEDAVFNKLSWAEDKEMVSLAKKLIKKSPHFK